MMNSGEESLSISRRTTSGFLSRIEVARLFGVSVSTVTRWARQGLLKALRTPGGHYRFPAEETLRAAGGSASSGRGGAGFVEERPSK